MYRRSVDIEPILHILQSAKYKFCCLKAPEKMGILPHEILGSSLVYVERDTSYEKRDFVIIKDRRLGNGELRITRNISSEEKGFLDKIVLAVNTFKQEG